MAIPAEEVTERQASWSPDTEREDIGTPQGYEEAYDATNVLF